MALLLRKRKVLVFWIVILSLVFSNIDFAFATSNSKIRNYNVGCQAVFTLISGIIEGKIHSYKDILSCLAAGAASGYGFYISKRMIGKGHVLEGVIFANISASLSENVSSGDNAFSHIGYSLGPFRFRYSLPWANNPNARINVDLSTMQAMTFVYSIYKYKNINFKEGLIFFKSNEFPLREDAGQTLGIFPAILYNSDQTTWRHESIHAMQALQIDSIEPSYFIFTIQIGSTNFRNNHLKFNAYPAKIDKKKIKLIKFGRIKNALFGSLNAILSAKQQYDRRWQEIEAYYFAK